MCVNSLLLIIGVELKWMNLKRGIVRWSEECKPTTDCGIYCECVYFSPFLPSSLPFFLLIYNYFSSIPPSLPLSLLPLFLPSLHPSNLLPLFFSNYLSSFLPFLPLLHLSCFPSPCFYLFLSSPSLSPLPFPPTLPPFILLFFYLFLAINLLRLNCTLALYCN